MKSCDVAVVGGGPAGIASADSAASEAERVALFERKPEIGFPVRCGEGVGFKGMNAGFGIKKEWVLSEIKVVRMISPSGTEVDLKKIGKSFIIDRVKMERDLMDQALDKGVRLYRSEPVVSLDTERGKYLLKTPYDTYSADYLIAADGVESRIARQAGWDTHLNPEDLETCAICRVESSTIDHEMIEFHIGSDTAPGGYAWVMPRGDGSANVGLGILGAYSESSKPLDYLYKFVKKRFGSSNITEVRAGGVPVARWLNPLRKGRALVVGDAARQVNCLNGGGVAYAMFAGKSAGEAVRKAVASGDDRYLDNYQRDWEAKCGKHQRISWALKEKVVSSDDSFLDSVASKLSAMDPERMTYIKVFWKVFSGNPVLLFKMIRLFL